MFKELSIYIADHPDYLTYKEINALFGAENYASPSKLVKHIEELNKGRKEPVEYWTKSDPFGNIRSVQVFWQSLSHTQQLFLAMKHPQEFNICSDLQYSASEESAL